MARMIGFFTVLVSLGCAGCDACPFNENVKLGDGSTQTVAARTGASALAGSTWAFYIDTPLSNLNLIGGVIGAQPGLIFRAQFGANGELVRVFDNVAVAPDTLGTELIIDGILRPAVMTDLFYSIESYGAGAGSALGITGCGLFYVGQFQAARLRFDFSGDLNSVLGLVNSRIDGSLRFVNTPNPWFALISGRPSQAETVEVTAFALKE